MGPVLGGPTRCVRTENSKFLKGRILQIRSLLNGIENDVLARFPPMGLLCYKNTPKSPLLDIAKRF